MKEIESSLDQKIYNRYLIITDKNINKLKFSLINLIELKLQASDYSLIIKHNKLIFYIKII